MNLIEFGTISHIKKGKKPLRQIDKPQDGYRPYVDIEAFETGNIKMYADGEKCLPCKAGDILIVCDGSRSGFVGKAIDGYVGSTLAIISADGMSQEYLYYFLQGKYALLNTKKKGTGTPHLDANILNQQKLVVPSIEEQKRIVARIEELFSELDNGVETLKKTKQQLAVYRQAVLKEAFGFNSGNIIDTDLDHIISVLTDYHANGSYETLKANVTLLDTPDYAIMVRSTNYENNDFSNDVKYINKHSYDFLKKSQLFGNEVLMGKIGNAGRVYFVKKLEKPMSLAMNMFAMRFIEDIDSKYVYYYLLSPTAKRDIKKYVKGVGTPTIDKKSVRAIKIRYPQSKEMQQEIVQDIEAKLSVCDSIEKTVDTALQQAEAMRQSILKKAFEGEWVNI